MHCKLFLSAWFLFCGPSLCGKVTFYCLDYSTETDLDLRMYMVTQSSYINTSTSYCKMFWKKVTVVDRTFHFKITKKSHLCRKCTRQFHLHFRRWYIQKPGKKSIFRIGKEFFSMGRKVSLHCAYLSQTYSQMSKQLCRDNCIVIVLFRQDESICPHAFDEHFTPEVSYDKLREWCLLCWNEPRGFLVRVKDFDFNDSINI